jgi:PmbA protein
MNVHNDSFVDFLIEKSIKEGATSCDCVVSNNESLTVSYRVNKIDSVENANSRYYSLRVFCGNKFATISSSNFLEENVNRMILQAINIAKNSPEDPDSFIADSSDLVKEDIDLNLFDSTEITINDLIEKVKIAEDTALSNNNVTNSDGSSASAEKYDTCYASSNGFKKSLKKSSFSISSSVIASDLNGMETDYDYNTARFLSDLESPEKIGNTAAQRAVSKLSSRKIDSQEIDVIYDSRCSYSILTELAAAINGSAITRGTSFLLNKMNEKIFNDEVNIIDNPLIKKGLASRYFDAEGIFSNTINIVENGFLTSWLLDLKTAKKLGLKSNGRASRSSSIIPSSTNLFLQATNNKIQDIISNSKKAILITGLFGGGVNLLTGNYSKGASGFMIENGEIAYPISEFTVASNLLDMFSKMIPADDLKMKNTVNAPSIFIPKMTISGT